ncbi:MAG: NTP transferase domain-containing protein [Planctomycetes bacterium]|nr:NTP transferase domain-containing protein [Planctomycetota bacterium]
MRYAVIMAGGAGVRLWPLSRKKRPKQLLRIVEGKSLLRQSYERVASLLPPERVFIITNHVHVPAVAQELPELPQENLWGEPQGRDTANAIGMAAALLAERDPEAVIGVFTADHIITPLDTFRDAVEKALDAAEQYPDALVTMGIRPTRPDTNFGYVKRGKQIADGVFEVEKFAEKPNVASAMKYLASGNYYWNSGMFAWRAKTILGELEKNMPRSHEAVCEIAAAWSTSKRQETLERLYPTLMKISIDFAVMEHAKRVLVVEMGCHWVDVGSWPAMESVVESDAAGNVSACKWVTHLGSRGNIVVSEEDHLIATIGVDDLVIVHSPDATLICTKRDSQSIKELVDNVREKFGDRYL